MAMEGEHEAEVTIPKLKVVILKSEVKMKVVYNAGPSPI